MSQKINTKKNIQALSSELDVTIPDYAQPFLLKGTFTSKKQLKEKMILIHETLKNKKNKATIESLQSLFKATISNIKLPLYGSSVSCGFTSPAEDHVDNQLSLDEFLVPNPNSTFFVRATGESMINAGIHDGDLLVIDRSVDPCHNNIVLAIVDTEFTVKRLIKDNGNIILRAENALFDDIKIKSSQHFMVWGVVIHVVHHLR